MKLEIAPKYRYDSLFSYVKLHEISMEERDPFLEWMMSNTQAERRNGRIRTMPIHLLSNFDPVEDEKDIFYGTFYSYDYKQWRQEYYNYTTEHDFTWE